MECHVGRELYARQQKCIKTVHTQLLVVSGDFIKRVGVG